MPVNREIVDCFGTMGFTSVLFFLVACCAAVTQGASQEVECYHCDGGPHSNWPDCLSHVHTCHHDEICKIKYGFGMHEIRCQKANDCQREISNPLRNCTGGGVEIHHNECQKCCADTQCVNDMTGLMKTEDQTSDNLRCPGDCGENHLENCINHMRTCSDGQFCQVTNDGHRTKGECKDDHDYHHCNEELNRHPCPGGRKCYWDCCTTNDCLMQHFGAYISTTPAPTTAAPTTVPMVTGDGSIFDPNNCKDQLTHGKCQELMMTKDVCHNDLALSICPDSCGLCSAINSTVCKDTVLNDGCKTLAQMENVCASELALFICPETCDMCDELINSVIDGLIKANVTDAPPTLASVANQSTPPPFNCEDLNSFGCGVLDGLCASSFIKVVCPERCTACSAMPPTSTTTTATTAATTTATSTMARTARTATTTTTIAAATTTATTATTPTPPTTATTATAPTTTPTTPTPPRTATTATAPTTTPTTPTPPRTATTATTTTGPSTNSSDTCSDHLDDGMDCSQLADVCGSVVAQTVCPKYCGLC